MGFKEILEKFKAPKAEEGPDFVEIEHQAEEGMKVSVKIDTLKAYADVDKIQGLVRDNSVVFLKIKDLREKDMAELKRSVEKIKKTAVAMNGDMVGVDEDFLIITPKTVKIYRGKAA